MSASTFRKATQQDAEWWQVFQGGTPLQQADMRAVADAAVQELVRRGYTAAQDDRLDAFLAAATRYAVESQQ
ncbi:hypothetical protein [Cupriavidus sp. AcVe19-6a]|uniref:hypothetical protein n=1 Tax=Cupriavidus sp. AcVe19-6a TaxID=2821358 RepID=UPI001AE10948|nr:hypothetical protein [Cupriavidus sp. AcVe19-6a]MBP0635530.1 hypothetical protein [Cupriavidus sp. AcVe19-6a]